MEHQAVEALIRQVADEIVRPRWRALRPDQIDQKRPGDYVTEADRESERALTAALLAADRDAVVVGEEATFEDPSRLSRLADAPHGWTVDPIDGTRNFVEGSPDYAIMVAELRDGETVAAWIFQPEHDAMWTATRGGGVRRNGAPVVPAPPREPFTGAASRKPPIGRSGTDIAPISPTAWCCGVDYPKLAAGEWDFLAYSHAKPWDHLPGALLVRELGGVVRLLDGSPYDAAPHTGGVLAARSGVVWDAAAAVVGGAQPPGFDSRRVETWQLRSYIERRPSCRFGSSPDAATWA